MCRFKHHCKESLNICGAGVQISRLLPTRPVSGGTTSPTRLVPQDTTRGHQGLPKSSGLHRQVGLWRSEGFLVEIFWVRLSRATDQSVQQMAHVESMFCCSCSFHCAVLHWKHRQEQWQYWGISSVCSNAMSGLSLVPLPWYASLTAMLFTSYESEYLVLSMHSASITRYKQEKQVQLDVVLTHLICTRVASQVPIAPLLARCHFTVLSNHELQGSRGITTVCLVYRLHKCQCAECSQMYSLFCVGGE